MVSDAPCKSAEYESVIGSGILEPNAMDFERILEIHNRFIDRTIVLPKSTKILIENTLREEVTNLKEECMNLKEECDKHIETIKNLTLENSKLKKILLINQQLINNKMC